MTSTRVIRFDSLVPTPWANGLGSTTEILRGRVGDEAAGPSDAWDFRISVARIEADSPFSPLPGVDRSLMALGPADLTLVVDGAPRILRPFDLVRFSGEDSVVPEGVAQPGLDLNLMTVRGSAEGSLELVEVRGARRFGGAVGTSILLVLLEGDLHAADETPLARLDALVGKAGAAVKVTGDARCALLRVQPA